MEVLHTNFVQHLPHAWIGDHREPLFTFFVWPVPSLGGAATTSTLPVLYGVYIPSLFQAVEVALVRRKHHEKQPDNTQPKKEC